MVFEVFLNLGKALTTTIKKLPVAGSTCFAVFQGNCAIDQDPVDARGGLFR